MVAQRGAVMPITLQTPEHLRVRCISLLGEGAFISFDRVAGRATVYRLISVIPWRRENLSFSAIEIVLVRKRERDTGASLYGIVLRLKSGDDIRLDCSSRDEAMHIMHAIVKFLGRDTADSNS